MRTKALIHKQSGNVLFYILIAIVLVGAVTAAIRRGGGEGSNIDAEQTSIAAAQIKQHAGELERGVAILLQAGTSESDLRFAHPNAPNAYGSITDTPSRQVFDRAGGGVEYRSAIAGVNDGSGWEFYATTHFPQIGSPAKADLVAVLPNVKAAMCAQLNALDNYTGQPEETGTCIIGGTRFTGTYVDTGSIHTTDETTFNIKPAPEACVKCDDGSLYFYHVLMAR